MRIRCIVAGIALAVLLPQAAAAVDAGTDSSATHPFTIPPPDLGRTAPGSFFLRDRLDAPTTGYLNLSLGITSLAWYTPPTRFDAVIHGAGSAATLGMFLGAIGNTLGWFDETTTWWLAGSLAAAGGIYAGTHYRPEPRIQIRLSTPGRPADGGQ